MKNFSRNKLKFSDKLGCLKKLLKHCERNSDGCLIFKGEIDDKGYGRIWINHRKYATHRLIMHLVNDFDLKSNMNINHKLECKSRACCESDHLYVGTQLENVRDAIKLGTLIPALNFKIASERRANATHCKWGHEFTKANTINNAGKRRCRQCNLEACRKNNARHKEEKLKRLV